MFPFKMILNFQVLSQKRIAAMLLIFKYISIYSYCAGGEGKGTLLYLLYWDVPCVLISVVMHSTRGFHIMSYLIAKEILEKCCFMSQKVY